MPKILISLIAIFLYLSVANVARAQQPPPEISACELAKHPKTYDGKTISFRSALNVEFEDFTLAVPNCESQQGIWLAFGGDVPGIVASLTNDNVRRPGVDVNIDGVSYQIKKDENFRKLYALISERHGDQPAYRVTATLTGSFLAGEERELSGGKTDFGGYGHLGCCALFVITRVAGVVSIPPARLHVRGIVLGPNGKPIQGISVIDDIVGGSPPERQQTITNDNGEFEFAISGQLLRIENPSYRPVARAVQPGGTPVHIKLEDAKASDWIVPACAVGMNSASRVGFSILFSVPATMESKPFNTVDSYSYFIFPRGDEETNAEFFISRSTDETEETNALGSVWSEQRWIKERTGNTIGIDARGRLKDGTPWRGASFLGRDTASYSLHSKQKAKSLDAIIDSACVAKQ